MRGSFLFYLLILLTNTGNCQNLNIPAVDNSTYTGKAMFGYQGWFGHPDDQSPRPDYWHWGNLDIISQDELNVDMYPDLREFCHNEKYPTAYSLPNGDQAYVFSSGNKQTVMRHMKWLRDYNTDGVFVQRFISEYEDRVVMRFRDSTTAAVREGCEKYGRVFAIMYDGVSNSVENIKNDWMHLIDEIGILSSDRYLQHEGRPLVALWGFTFYDEARVEQLESLIEWFHNTAPLKYRASIKLGINDNWFNLNQDWLDALARVEVISPWSVGRYANQNSYNRYLNNQILVGKQWCDTKGILYVPVLFPGFSWHNLHNGESVQNQIPRNGGEFYWMQVHGAITNNLESLYFAMFDELDESTAMFKTSENSSQAPNQQYWLSLNADGFDLPSDWYLRCAGKAAETLRGNINIDPNLGIPAEGIMTIIPDDKECKLTFVFPDFEGEDSLEISIDGGVSYPFITADNVGSLEISGLQDNNYDIFVRHPGSDAVPMGKTCLDGECTISSTNNQLAFSELGFIKIFPNPIRSSFRIEGLDGLYKLEIFNIYGKRLINKMIQDKGEIDLSMIACNTILIVKLEQNGIAKVYKTIKL